MLKALCFLTVVSIIIQNAESVPAVLVVNLTNFKIEPNNNFILELGNGLIEWQKKLQEGADGIQIYDVHIKNGKEFELEDLCTSKPRTILPKILKGLLGILTCPIEKGTLSLITKEFSEPRQLSSICHPELQFTLRLRSKKDKNSIMTLNLTYKTLRLDDCDSSYIVWMLI